MKGGDINGSQETDAVGRRQRGRHGGALRLEDNLYARLRSHQYLVERSRRIIARALSVAAPWSVAFSGGKDSTVLLALVREHVPDLSAVFVDSGAEYPETLAFVEDTPNVLVVHPTMTLLEMYREVGDYGSQAVRPDTHWRQGQLIESLIREPMTYANETYGLAGNFTGLRAEESAARARMGSYRHRLWRSKSGTWRCEPLMNWTYRDIWAYIAGHDLAYNTVYDRLAEIGVEREHWRVAAYAGSTGLGLGRWAVLKHGWPDLFNRLAAVFPQVRAYT